MSRAAVKARQVDKRALQRQRQDARLVERLRQLEAYEAQDAIEARCDGCGFVQAWCGSSSEPVGCLMCGTVTGSFVRWLPGHLLLP